MDVAIYSFNPCDGNEVVLAEREPKIKEFGSPTYTDERLTRSGKRELEGFMLNSHDDMACVFLDREKNLCTIYETRPLGCRVFDCNGEGREQMIELGIFEKDSSKRPDSDSR
jgi:Fe-S-cluster containining protein